MSSASTFPTDRHSASADDAHVALLLKLARLLVEAGLPAHRVEEVVLQLAERFATPVEVFVIPTNVWLSFPRPGGPAMFMQRVMAGPVNLERLDRLSAVADDVIRGALTGAEANACIDAIYAAAPRWKPAAIITAYVLSAIAFAVFFGAGASELIVSSCVGLVVGAIGLAMQRTRARNRLFELVAATAAALVAGAADWAPGSYSDWIPLASGLIILLPGIALVDAIEELAHGRLAAGGARMAGVGVVFLAMTFGTVLGTALAELVPGETHGPLPAHLPDGFLALALVAVALGSTVRFRARPGDVVVIFAASAVALVASRAGAQVAGHLAGAFVAALALGLLSNLYAWVSRRAAELVVIPGLAVLVPGSIGVCSIEALLTKNTTQGVDAAFDMFMVAMALVGGLLFSNALTRDRAGS